MELHQLRYFVAVAEKGNFRAAADRCNVSQPSLSQQVIKLERELGRQLFDRLSRGAVLTEAGEVFLPRAREILAQVRLAAREVSQDSQARRGKLSVGALPTIAPFLLPPVIQRLHAAFPDIELEVTEDVTPALVADLVAANLDLAVLSLPLESEQVEHEELMAEPFLAVDRPGGPLAATDSETVSLATVREQPVIVLHEVHCLGDQQTRALCGGSDNPPRIVCRTSQLGTVLSLVSLGLGVSLVPRMCAAADHSSQRFYQPLDDDSVGRSIGAAWRTGRTRSSLLDACLDALRDVCHPTEGTACRPEPASAGAPG